MLGKCKGRSQTVHDANNMTEGIDTAKVLLTLFVEVAYVGLLFALYYQFIVRI